MASTSSTHHHSPPLPLPSLTLLSLLLLLVVASPRGAAAGAPNTEALSMLCNGASYGAGDPFAASLAYVLSELVSATPTARRIDGGGGGGLEFYDISPYPTAFAYGHASCRPAVAAAATDCAACLRSAVSQMGASCGHSVGARAVLVDCSVRYEQYAFVD